MTKQMVVKQKFSGERYDITVVSDSADGHFEIIAEHKESGRQSSVTNMNFMLGNILNVDDDDQEVDAEDVEIEVEDSWATIDDPTKHKNITERALRLFKDKDWVVNDVEPALDDDRSCGEWGDDEDEDEDDDEDEDS